MTEQTPHDDRDDWYDPRDDWYDEDDEEDVLTNCSWTGRWGDSCGAIGSEDCDWECSLSREMWQGLRTSRDARGRFAKKTPTP